MTDSERKLKNHLFEALLYKGLMIGVEGYQPGMEIPAYAVAKYRNITRHPGTQGFHAAFDYLQEFARRIRFMLNTLTQEQFDSFADIYLQDHEAENEVQPICTMHADRVDINLVTRPEYGIPSIHIYPFTLPTLRKYYQQHGYLGLLAYMAHQTQTEPSSFYQDVYTTIEADLRSD